MSFFNNIRLVIKYPFLLPRNRWSDKPTRWDWVWSDLKSGKIKNALKDIYHFECTELDAMEDGWREAFGEQMCEEIKQSLLKSGGRKALHKYRIEQIKEKFGTLRWYDANSTEEVYDIIDKYEHLSMCYCIYCGKPVRYKTNGWIEYLCEDCFEKIHKYEVLDDLKKECRLTRDDIPHIRKYNSITETWDEVQHQVDFENLWGLE